MIARGRRRSKKRIGLIILSLFLALIIGFIISTYIISENNFEHNQSVFADYSMGGNYSAALGYTSSHFITDTSIAEDFRFGRFSRHDHVMATTWISAFNAQRYLMLQNPGNFGGTTTPNIPEIIKFLDRYGNLSYGSRLVNPYAIKWYFEGIELESDDKRINVDFTFSSDRFADNVRNSDISIFMFIANGKTTFMNLIIDPSNTGRYRIATLDMLAPGRPTSTGVNITTFNNWVDEVGGSFRAMISMSVVDK